MRTLSMTPKAIASRLYYKNNYQKERARCRHYKKNHPEKILDIRYDYMNRIEGYMKERYNSMKFTAKQKKVPFLFENFDQYMNHWNAQYQRWGMWCPGCHPTHLMTMLRRRGGSGGKRKMIGTNISNDQLISSAGYSLRNHWFVCWDYNNRKRNFKISDTKNFLKIVKERKLEE